MVPAERVGSSHALKASDRRSAPGAPRATLDWAADALGAGSSIVSVRLMGVSSTTLHAIDAVDAAGRRHRLALRRFHDAARLRADPWYVPANEAQVLTLLEGSEVPAPRLVAADAEGRRCDVPALLTTRLRGHPPGRPRDMESFLAQLARALVSIHAVDGRAAAALPRYAPYHDPVGDGERRIPPWSRHVGAWERAFEIIAAPAPETPVVFIHRDYHPGQTLWAVGALTGVVDWTTGCRGPRGIDLARMRLNLAGDFPAGSPERFLDIHRSIAGEDLRHPYWDLLDAADSILDMPGPDSPREALSYASFDDWVARVVAETG